MKTYPLKTLLSGFFFILVSTVVAEETTKPVPQQWWKKFKVEIVQEDLFKKKNTSKDLSIKKTTSENLKKWAVRPSLGLFDPDILQWSSYYENNNVINFGLESNYYLTENWSLNFGLNHIEATGKGVLGISGATGADVKTTFTPLHIGFQYEQIYKEQPFIRPLAGIGYTYTSYKLDSASGNDIKGHADGYYAKLGVSFNFYHLKSLQNSLISHYDNLYWTLEAKKSWIDAGQFKIGGLNYSLGLSVRF